MHNTLKLLSLAAGLAFITHPALCGTRRLVQEMRLQKIDFEDATVQDVFKYLREISRRQDPANNGVNFFFKPSSEAKQDYRKRRINISLQNMPFLEALHYVCIAADLVYRIESAAIVIAERGTAVDKMETRFYAIEAGVLDATATRRAETFDLSNDDQ